MGIMDNLNIEATSKGVMLRWKALPGLNDSEGSGPDAENDKAFTQFQSVATVTTASIAAVGAFLL